MKKPLLGVIGKRVVVVSLQQSKDSHNDMPLQGGFIPLILSVVMILLLHMLNIYKKQIYYNSFRRTPMKNLKFYIIFLSLSILFLLFDWYYSRKLNLDYIKIIILSLTIVFAYQLLIQSYTVTYDCSFNIICILSFIY